MFYEVEMTFFASQVYEGIVLNSWVSATFSDDSIKKIDIVVENSSVHLQVELPVVVPVSGGRVVCH